MPSDVEVKMSPPDLLRRMRAYPRKLDSEMKRGIEQSKLHVVASVPPYPVAPAGVDDSGRTGTLGRTLGSSMGGGAGGGRPEIYKTRKLGAGNYEARIGTRRWYAPRVIGENQGNPWASYWWNIGTIAKNATEGIVRIFDSVADRMAAFLDGRG